MNPPLHSKAALAAITLGFAQDEYIATDIAADEALHELATFCETARLWEDADVKLLASLTERAHAAEERRRHAKNKLVWEWCRAVQAAGTGEETP